ncbi:DUF6228 family protein [Streptomyces sp. NPDC048196]|uniref:DUF6228 family protein n=1 Tax=Streptomyces sp. NPDC048196 TaxID=3154712 RepID=UPI0033D89FCD
MFASTPSGGHVHLTWSIHDRPPAEEWHFETMMVHAAGQDMQHLAAEIMHFFPASTPAVDRDQTS